MPVTFPPGRRTLVTSPTFNRVGAGDEHHRDGAGRVLRRQVGWRAAGCRNYVDFAAHQIGRQLREAICLTLGPAEFDDDVLANNVAAAFLQAIAERG